LINEVQNVNMKCVYNVLLLCSMILLNLWETAKYCFIILVYFHRDNKLIITIKEFYFILFNDRYIGSIRRSEVIQ